MYWVGSNMFFILIWISSADERVPTELKKAIMQARMEKKLTQAQLAQVTLSLSLSLSPPYFDLLKDKSLFVCRLSMRSLKLSRSMNLVKLFPTNRSLPSWRGPLERNCEERNKKKLGKSLMLVAFMLNDVAPWCVAR
jgi:hypothetical protein